MRPLLSRLRVIVVQEVKANQPKREFNELVNMSAKELQDWLGQDESAGSGWYTSKSFPN